MATRSLPLRERSDVFVTASYDGTASVWQVTASPWEETLEATEGGVLEVLPDFVVNRAFYGDSAHRWDPAGGVDVTEKLRLLLSSGCTSIRINSETFGEPMPCGQRELVVEGSRLQQMSRCLLTLPIDGGCPEVVGEYGERSMMTAVFSKDCSLILTAMYDGVASLWCPKTGLCVKSFRGEGDKYPGLYTAFFSPDESRVLTASASGVARLFRISDGCCEWELRGHNDAYMRCAIFSPDMRRLLTCSADNTARLWRVELDLGVPQLALILQGHEGWVNTVLFSPDSSMVLTSAADGTARLWQTDSGKELQTYRGHSHFVRTALFSPDVTQVLTSSFDWTAKLWSLEGQCVQTFRGHEQAVNSAQFSPDGMLILTSSRDCTARLWDRATGTCLRTLTGHNCYTVWASFASSVDNFDFEAMKRQGADQDGRRTGKKRTWSSCGWSSSAYETSGGVSAPSCAASADLEKLPSETEQEGRGWIARAGRLFATCATARVSCEGAATALSKWWVG